MLNTVREWATMGSMETQELNLPPFPALRWNTCLWTGTVLLRSWAGFQSRRGAYGSLSAHIESDGSAGLNVIPQDDDARTPPLPEQANAFGYLVDHEQTVSDSIQRAIFSRYPSMRDSYGYSEEEAADLMPEIDGIEKLRSLIGLSNICVLPVAKSGIAYIGFEFGCTWDCEHGLGVMTHKDRVVEVGGADASFLEWIAEDDAAVGG